jgi:N-acetylmuramoyl-L-alanine amidase
MPPDWQGDDAVAAPTLPAIEVIRPETPIAPPPAAPANDPPPAVNAFAGETWIPLARWAQAHHRPSPLRQTSNGSVLFEMAGPHGTLVLRIGHQTAAWNGISIWLGFKPQLIDDQPFVHTLDLQKTIQPLLLDGESLTWPASPLIVLDPGHGGINSGTRSVLGVGMEKEYTLDWALRTRDLLVAQGWRVALTRTTDVDISLSNRVAFTSARNADLFVSLHFNSAGVESSHAGLETYCLTPRGMASGVTRDYEDDLLASFPNNRFDEKNIKLATAVHRALLRVNGNDRGVRRARFLGVLRNQERPAILVEAGYLSSPAEARKVADPQYRQRLAEALAEGLTGRVSRPNPPLIPAVIDTVATNGTKETAVQ